MPCLSERGIRSGIRLGGETRPGRRVDLVFHNPVAGSSMDVEHAPLRWLSLDIETTRVGEVSACALVLEDKRIVFIADLDPVFPRPVAGTLALGSEHDEVPKTAWLNGDHCRQRMRDEHLRDDFDPAPASLPAAARDNILGGQANLWSELLYFGRQAEYMLFPRLCAIAEALWTPVELKDFNSFSKRMELHGLRLDGLGVQRYRGPLQV